MIGLVKIIVERFNSKELEGVKTDIKVIHTDPELEEDITNWYCSHGWEVTLREEI